MRKSAAALPLLALLAACTVGPRYEEPPDMATPAHFDQATAEATAEPAGSELWRGFGSTELDKLIARALAANTTIAQASARLAETRAMSGLSVYYWFPTVTAAGDRQKAQFSSRRPARARRHPHRHLARGIRRAVGNRPVRLAAQRVPRDRPAHRGGRGGPRRCAAVDRRGDGAGLVRDDRRARAPRAAAAAARKPGGEHPDPRRRA